MAATVSSFISAINDSITSNKVFLTDLDGVIGDADHGINMTRGFNAVVLKVSEEDSDVGATLKKVGMTLISTVGGASGPLYGTAFMKAGGEAAGMTTLDGETISKMWLAALEGIKARGKATLGEKTMIDAIEPAMEAFNKAMGEGATIEEGLDKAIEAAEVGIEYTKTIRATKGRASYLGDRSIGHQDPGATSFTIILKTIAEHYKKEVLGV
ncbi:dihydroxyacetone kinase, C-terminal domain [Petrocella atlantisensis]|uniref:phosphoenolpyruvate--glycerone phosphotransferase n=1 Tax=Petrocella atlantisensis TaxID=2173034 RepID=A0A3P7P9C1_9FIRM|nr:dihydroxyacetone kinase subunit DhaL [Petrocella atlantisensis]VDN46783.1 dihydroxyacetone kinase, C-terminal domain [Petrocella atlantisensis]